MFLSLRPILKTTKAFCGLNRKRLFDIFGIIPTHFWESSSAYFLYIISKKHLFSRGFTYIPRVIRFFVAKIVATTLRGMIASGFPTKTTGV